MLKTVLFAALALGALSGDKVTFDWKPEKGQTASYKFTNSHKADFGGGPQELVIAWTSKITVDKVDGKKVWLKLENGEPVATIGGASADGVQVQIADQTEEHALDGKFFAASLDEHMGFGLYSGFRLPGKALEAGESYEVEGMKAKYVGLENVGEWDAHKFSFENRPSKNEADQWSKGEIWLSTKDLSLVKRKAVLNNIDFGMGPESITNEVVRTK
jgi:hypothetical protein